MLEIAVTVRVDEETLKDIFKWNGFDFTKEEIETFEKRINKAILTEEFQEGFIDYIKAIAEEIYYERNPEEYVPPESPSPFELNYPTELFCYDWAMEDMFEEHGVELTEENVNKLKQKLHEEKEDEDYVEIVWTKLQETFERIVEKWIEEMSGKEEEKEETEEENKCSRCGESEWESEYDERMGMEMVVCIKCGNYYYPEIG